MRTSQVDQENCSLTILAMRRSHCQPLGLLTINQHHFLWKEVFRLERTHTMKLNKGRGITCRPVRFPPIQISNEDSQSSCIHQAPCMKLSFLMLQVVDLYQDISDNLFIRLFIVHQCEANFSAQPHLCS